MGGALLLRAGLPAGLRLSLTPPTFQRHACMKLIGSSGLNVGLFGVCQGGAVMDRWVDGEMERWMDDGWADEITIQEAG